MGESEPSSEAKEVEFEPIKESWNIYKIEDGTILKARLVIMRVFLDGIDKDGNPTYEAAGQTLLAINAPQDLRGPKSTEKYSSEELGKLMVAEDLKFDTIREDWNEYRLEDGTILGVKFIVTTINRTSKYDEHGNPIYRVFHQAIFKGKKIKT